MMLVSSPIPSANLSHAQQNKPRIPTTETLEKRLRRKGVEPTPKILHNLRKKETLKSLRRAKKKALNQQPPPLTEAQKQSLAEDDRFNTIRAEYREFRKELVRGRPWERGTSDANRIVLGEGEGRENLEELRVMLKERNRVQFEWLLDDDVEFEEEYEGRDRDLTRSKKRVMGDEQKIEFLVKSLGALDVNNLHDWRFVRLMKQSEITYHEMNVLNILKGLEKCGSWRQALCVVQWVYSQKNYKQRKSRFVYTKLLSILGKARMAAEALKIFKYMRTDAQIYPDMAAYHSIAVTLGQAGHVNELIKVIEEMREKDSKKIRSMKRKNWDPSLQPDVIIYNAVLNSCIASSHWKGVFWVFDQMRYNCVEPTSASYGLAMEVMLNSGKYSFVHKFFERMKKNGLATQAITYKVLVKCLGKEGRVREAVEAVREMETRGIIGESSVYYELACCLCKNGKWHDAILEVEKLKKLPRTKPLEFTFTGMIISSSEGGYIENCISMFRLMKEYCNPNIGTINAMLRVYSKADMFSRAKELFESIEMDFGLKANLYTYNSMLEACASSLQWEYFEFVYREMALNGFELDQRKYGKLLIEASQSGKFILLEHAFNATLETGSIPEVPIFTEMICQTISQDNLERALSLINCMAHASLKVNESQWTSILRENLNMVRKDVFHDLLKYINTHHILSEEPASSFLRSLEALCSDDLEKLSEEPKQCLKLGTSSDEFKYDLNLNFLSRRSVVDEVIRSFNADRSDIFEELPSAEEILEMWSEES